MPRVSATDFTKGPLIRHVAVMSVTSSIGIMAIYLVDLLDLLFISMLGHKEIAAAAGIAGTLLFFVSTINIGVSIATGTLAGRAIGRGQAQEALGITATAVQISLCLGILIPILMIPNLGLLFSLIGADDELARLARGYVIIILPATFLSGISMNLVATLRAQGKAKMAMFPSLAGAAVNLVLDPIFIFGLGLELQGAAVATVMARLATMGVALYFFKGQIRDVLSPNMKTVVQNAREIGKYAWHSAMSSVALPVGQAILIRYVAIYGEAAVAGIAILGRLSPVVFSLINGLSGAIGPIIAHNFGAHKSERVQEAYFAALKFLAGYVAIVTLALFLSRGLIADAFSAYGLTREIIYLYCSPFAIISFFNGIIFVSNAAFNSLGHPNYSTRLSWAKNTIGLLPTIMLGSYLFGFWGVAYGALITSALFATASFVIVQRVICTNTLTKCKPEKFDFADAQTLTQHMQEDELQF